ncbi:hypothetical protein DFJ73DRAFT_856145 [Zopfochytrium polystomum]|nr:hypothetical protein DFJ73DRAFT_856145 [Zopfochytrium polystomum]
MDSPQSSPSLHLPQVRRDSIDDDAATLHDGDVHYHRYSFLATTPVPRNAPLSTSAVAAASPGPFLKRKLSHFHLQVLGNKTVFLPGECVEGSLSFEVHSPLEVMKLAVELKGISYASVFKDRGKKTIPEESLYSSSSHVIFKEIYDVLPFRIGSPYTLEPGRHQYPIRCYMPTQALPASFEGCYGRVEYRLQALIMPKFYSARSTILKLTVPSTVNAADNTFSLAQVKTRSMSDNIWPWKTGRVEVTLSIPRGAFSPEALIPASVQIRNHSASDITIDHFELQQKTKYCAISETKTVVERSLIIPVGLGIPTETRIFKHEFSFPAPSTSDFSPALSTPLVEVTHCLIVKVSATLKAHQVAARGSGALFYQKIALHRQPPSVSVSVPFLLGGFPFRAASLVMTLPRYVSNPSDDLQLLSVDDGMAQPSSTDGLASALIEDVSSSPNADVGESSTADAGMDIDYELLYGPSEGALSRREANDRKGVEVMILSP